MPSEQLMHQTHNDSQVYDSLSLSLSDQIFDYDRMTQFTNPMVMWTTNM